MNFKFYFETFSENIQIVTISRHSFNLKMLQFTAGCFCKQIVKDYTKITPHIFLHNIPLGHITYPNIRWVHHIPTRLEEIDESSETWCAVLLHATTPTYYRSVSRNVDRQALVSTIHLKWLIESYMKFLSWHCQLTWTFASGTDINVTVSGDGTVKYIWERSAHVECTSNGCDVCQTHKRCTGHV